MKKKESWWEAVKLKNDRLPKVKNKHLQENKNSNYEIAKKGLSLRKTVS